MGKGYFSIGLVRPKSAVNVGAVMRACGVYSAASLVIQDRRNGLLKNPTDTMKAWKRIPVYRGDSVFDFIPFDCQCVAVDIIPGATPLPEFEHPDRALYIFGPEDGTLGKVVTDHCQHTVYIPTVRCMNLAATANVVMYDRRTKLDDWPV